MADFLSIEAQGSRELREYLLDAVRRLESPRVLLQTIGARLESSIQRRFDTKTDPEGKPWAPLAASTREQYDRADTSKRGPRRGEVARRGTLLERTRQMRQSLTSTVGDDQVEVGMTRVTDDGKWQVPLLHEFGTDRGLPRRGIFFADPEAGTLGAQDDADIQADVLDFLDDVFGA